MQASPFAACAKLLPVCVRHGRPPAPMAAQRLSCAPSPPAEMPPRLRDGGREGAGFFVVCLSHPATDIFTVSEVCAFGSFASIRQLLIHVFKGFFFHWLVGGWVFFAKNVCWRLMKLLCWSFVTLNPKVLSVCKSRAVWVTADCKSTSLCFSSCVRQVTLNRSIKN